MLKYPCGFVQFLNIFHKIANAQILHLPEIAPNKVQLIARGK